MEATVNSIRTFIALNNECLVEIGEAIIWIDANNKARKGWVKDYSDYGTDRILIGYKLPDGRESEANPFKERVGKVTEFFV